MQRPAPVSSAALPGSVSLFSNRLLVLAILILAISAATILGALGFEHIGRYQPCALCLMQRTPYYIGVPLAAVIVLATGMHVPRPLLALLFAAMAALMVYSAGLAAYHAGVEWKIFEGPAACAQTAAPGSLEDMFDDLENAHPPSCTEATWRFLWLSFAGWNFVVSLILVALAGAGAALSLRRAPA